MGSVGEAGLPKAETRALHGNRNGRGEGAHAPCAKTVSGLGEVRRLSDPRRWPLQEKMKISSREWFNDPNRARADARDPCLCALAGDVRAGLLRRVERAASGFAGLQA